MSHVEWLTAFDHAKSQVQQFTHGSTDNNHHWLSLIEQVFAEGLDHWIKAPGVNRREVERFAQVAATDLRQPALTLKRRSRLIMSGRQTDERRELSGAGEVGKGNFSQQLVSRDTTDTGDAFEQFGVSLERGMLVDVVVDSRLDRSDLLIQVGNHRLKRILDSTVQAGLEPILLLLLEVFEILKSPNQSLELLDLGSQWYPGVGLLFETEAGDDEGVLLVGLVATQAALGVVLDASGIDHTNPVTFGHEKLRERQTITARGLEADVEFLDTLLSQPCFENAKAFWRVGKDFVQPSALFISKQHHVGISLTDIDSEYHRASHPLCSTTPRVSLVNTGSGFGKAPPRIPSDLKKRGKGDLISFSGLRPRAMSGSSFPKTQASLSSSG